MNKRIRNIISSGNYKVESQTIEMICKNHQITALKQKMKEIIAHKDKEIEELKALVNSDHLTNLSNKKITDYNSDFLRYPFIIIMADIDNFKAVNDTYGHGMGDLVLKLIAKIIFSRIRTTDLAIRYGGDEFQIILWSCDMHRALDVVGLIKNRVKELSKKELGIDVTMSFGLANYNPPKSNIFEAVNNADWALYQSKHKGKDSISYYGENSSKPVALQKRMDVNNDSKKD